MARMSKSALVLIVIFALVPSVSAGQTWPTSSVTNCVESPYGWREYDISHFHSGWDIPDGSNYDVYAVAAGTVYLLPARNGTGWRGYDFTVIIDHGDYFMGYHHLDSRADIEVGNYVSEGDYLGSLVTTSAHLHLNHWDENFGNSSNTLHPGRIMGDVGSDDMSVVPSVGSCGILVHTEANLIKAGVNVYGENNFNFVWDMEGNVRSAFSWIDDGGNLKLSATSNGHTFTIDTPESWNCGSSKRIKFGFPCEAGDVIDNNADYTFMRTASGGLYYILEPVNNIFTDHRIERGTDGAVVSWRISLEGGGRWSDLYSFRIWRTCFEGTAELVESGVSEIAPGVLAVVDPFPCEGACYQIDGIRKIDGRKVSEVSICFKGEAKTEVGLRAEPNPANGSTVFRFQVSNWESAQALEIYDLRGRLVRTLKIGEASSGAVTWNLDDVGGSSVASGIYSVRLVGRNAVIARARVCVLK